MPEPITSYRIFIASPSRLPNERKGFCAEIIEFNERDARDKAEARGYWTKARDLYQQIGMPHRVKKVQGWLDGRE